MKKYLGMVCIFLVNTAYAADIQQYWVPDAATIPKEFKLFTRYIGDGYTLQFNDGIDGRLIFSETASSPQYNYDGMLENYNLLIKANRLEKLKDLKFHGLRGVLVREDNRYIPDSVAFTAMIDDNGKLLTISTNDAPAFHFSQEQVEAIINGMTRQEISGPNFALYPSLE